MKSLGIIFAAIVTTVIIFAVAILVGNIIVDVAKAIYNKVKSC